MSNNLKRTITGVIGLSGLVLLVWIAIPEIASEERKTTTIRKNDRSKLRLRSPSKMGKPLLRSMPRPPNVWT